MKGRSAESVSAIKWSWSNNGRQRVHLEAKVDRGRCPSLLLLTCTVLPLHRSKVHTKLPFSTATLVPIHVQRHPAQTPSHTHTYTHKHAQNVKQEGADNSLQAHWKAHTYIQAHTCTHPPRAAPSARGTTRCSVAAPTAPCCLCWPPQRHGHAGPCLAS